MSRRRFLKTVAMAGAGVMAGGFGARGRALAQQTAPTSATKRPIRMLLGGYGPSTTGFSLALKRIGDRVKARFGDEVDIKYVYNVLDLGYREDDLNWMVESGVLTLSYQSSGYFTNEVPDLGVNDLPFLFPDVQAARAAIDGRFGQALAARLEARMNCRVLGYFEAGFQPALQRVAARPHAGGHEGDARSRAAEQGPRAHIRAVGRRAKADGPLRIHRSRQSRHRRCAGESVSEHRHL